MSLRALALEWSVDGAIVSALLTLTAAAAVYVSAAAIGRRRDRRHRRWSRRRTACFIAGLAVLIVDLCSGIGTQADTQLSVHMLEHMVMWVVVAPLLAAGAPVRLALFALARPGRKRLVGWLRSRPLSALTAPVGSVSLFAVVILITHIPVVYGWALRSDYAHVAEHALYLSSAVLMWATVMGVDPLPHRLGTRGQVTCLIGCMVPMLMIAVWLWAASEPVYGGYVEKLGAAALHDQRLAATIMWFGGLPALLVPARGRLRAGWPAEEAVASS